MPRTANTGDWLALLALTSLWGSSFALTKLALASFPPSVLVAGRVAIAAIVMLIWMRARGVALPVAGRDWLPMAVIAVLGNWLPFQLIAWAQQRIPSSTAAILMAVMPLFILTLAHFFVPGQRLTRGRVAGFVFGFAGVVLVIGPDALGRVNDSAALGGALAVLAAALSYSVNSIYARRLGVVDPARLASGMLIVSTLLALPGAAVEVDAVARPGVLPIASLLILGLFSTGLATLLYLRVIQGPGPAFLSLVNYLVPAWAVVIGAAFLGETVSPSTLTGLTLILAGVAVSELAPRLIAASGRLRRLMVLPGSNRVAPEEST